MARDVNHYWSGDISESSSKDIRSATGVELTNQRILRRLLTSPGEYPWHPEYGAGLPREIGSTADRRRIEQIIRSNLALEQAVARTPLPVITISPLSEGTGPKYSWNTDERTWSRGIFVSISYTESATKTRASLQFDLEN